MWTVCFLRRNHIWGQYCFDSRILTLHVVSFVHVHVSYDFRFSRSHNHLAFQQAWKSTPYPYPKTSEDQPADSKHIQPSYQEWPGHHHDEAVIGPSLLWITWLPKRYLFICMCESNVFVFPLYFCACLSVITIAQEPDFLIWDKIYPLQRVELNLGACHSALSVENDMEKHH